MLHDGAAEKSIVDATLDKIAVDPASGDGRPESDVHAPLPVVLVSAANGFHPALIRALELRIIHKGVTVHADETVAVVNVATENDLYDA
jgi:hypothetical protein